MTQQFLGTLFTGVTIALVAQPACWALPETNINEIAKQITVRLTSDSGAGSGVLIQQKADQYTLLTAGHVLSNEGTYQVITSDGQSYSLDRSSIRNHATADLAIATFQADSNYPIATLAPVETVEEGSSIYVAGYPARTLAIDESIYSFSRGQLMSRATTLLRDGYGLVYDNQTLPGMSGGPVLNQEGHLVGIHGRADSTIGIQEEQVNPDVYIKSGANLGLPVNLALSLIPKSELTYANPINKSLIDDLWLQANFHLRQGNREKAIDILGKILKIDPTYADAYQEKADIYLIMGDPFSAIIELSQVVELRPNKGEGFYNLGVAYLRTGSPREARASFEQAANLFKANKQTDKYKATKAQLKRFKR